MRKRNAVYVLMVLPLLAMLCLTCGVWAATTVPDWMSRSGTVLNARSLPDGSHVYLDAESIVKIKPIPATPYILIAEQFSRKDRLVVLTFPSEVLRMGQLVDIEGDMTTLPSGDRAVENVTIWGYTDQDGNLLTRGGPLCKGLLERTEWDYMVDLTVRPRVAPEPAIPLPGEPNTTPPKGPTYYPRISDVLHRVRLLADGDFIDLAEFECKPIVSTGVDQTYGNYFIMGEDVGQDTLKVYYQTAVSTTDRINKVSGQLREENGGQVLCVNSGPGYDPQVYEGSIQTVAEGTIAWVKTFPDGMELPAPLTDKIVSGYIFPYLYIQEEDRSSGIGVPGPSTVPWTGKVVSIPSAWVTTHEGERVLILPPGVNIEIGDDQEIRPLGMPNRSISGGAFNVLTPGATDAFGLNNVGLLVRTWGKITSYDPEASYIYITDGSDSTGIKVGVKEYYGELNVDDYVAVTGISRLEADGEQLIKRIDIRSTDDLQVVSSAQLFMNIAASPGHGMSDDEVVVTFSSTSEMAAQPTVTVNGHSATYQDNSGNDYTYSYTILSSDAPGWATVTVSGTDVNARSGSKSSTSVLLVLSSDNGYDGNDNRTTMRDSRGTTLYEYDVLGRLTKVTEPDGKWIAYKYDLNSNRTKMTVHLSDDPLVEHLTDYTYNSRGLLWKVYDQLADRDQYGDPTPSAVYTGYTYNDNGSVSRIDYPNGTYTEFAYDDCELLTGIQNKKSDGTVIAAFTYEHDPTYWGENGTRTAMTEDILKPDGYRVQARVDYEYDDLYRLTREYRTGSLAYDKLYAYDPAGNRLSKTENSTPTYYTYNDANKMLTAGAASFTHDDAGNMLTRTVGGVTTNYTWDQWNTLTRYQVGAQPQVDLLYDGDGFRVGKTVSGVSTRYLLDDTEVAEEITGTNVTSYVRPALLSRIDGTGRYVFHPDGMGSTRAESDSSQQSTQAAVYDAYGNMVAAYPTGDLPFGYAGQFRYYSDSETELQHLWARYYDPAVGRFVSADPIGYEDSLNLYAYVDNAPTMEVDPFGLSGYWGEYWKALKKEINPFRKGSAMRRQLKSMWDYEKGDWEKAAANSGWAQLQESHASSATFKAYTATQVVAGAAAAAALAAGAAESGCLTNVIVKARATPGADGATSQIIKTVSKLSGRTIKVVHKVVSKGGKVIHQHSKFRRFLPF